MLHSISIDKVQYITGRICSILDLRVFQSVEAVRSAADHKVVDLFALLILHVIQRKPVESLVRNKVRSGHFTEQLVEKMFAGHAKVSRHNEQRKLGFQRVFG